MALLALKCVHEHRGMEGIHRILHDGYEALGGLQKADGSFGNIHTTVLMIQVCASSNLLIPSRSNPSGNGQLTIAVSNRQFQGLGLDENFGEYWNETSGILGLAALQSSDGSFEQNIVGTTDALLAISTLLNGSGILKLKRHQCSTYTYQPLDSIMMSRLAETNSQTSSGPVAWNRSETGIPIDREIHKGPTPSMSSPLPGVTPPQEFSSETSVVKADQVLTVAGTAETAASESPLLSIKYSLWIGGDPATVETHNLTLSVPANTSFFHVMQRAAELDPTFQ